jgi:hypothetical protein
LQILKPDFIYSENGILSGGTISEYYSGKHQEKVGKRKSIIILLKSSNFTIFFVKIFLLLNICYQNKNIVSKK